jgi:hypothetical protein
MEMVRMNSNLRLKKDVDWFEYLESLVISLIRSKFLKRCMSPGVVLPVEPVYQVLGKFGSRGTFTHYSFLLALLYLS